MKKDLGQNFLINNKIAMDIAKRAKGKKVLEIGGGKGILTRQLAENKNILSLTVAELDEKLYEGLLREFRKDKTVVILQGDVLNVNFNDFDEIIGNIPYYISSDITIKFLNSTCPKATLMVQKEFGEKLANAKEGNWTRLAIMANAKCTVKTIMEVEKYNFDPAPTVDSEVIELKKKSKQSHLNEKLVNALFQHKNQNLKKAILHSATFLRLKKDDLKEFVETLKHKTKRPVNLSLKELEDISEKFEKRFLKN